MLWTELLNSDEHRRLITRTIKAKEFVGRWLKFGIWIVLALRWMAKKSPLFCITARAKSGFRQLEFFIQSGRSPRRVFSFIALLPEVVRRFLRSCD